MIFIEAKRFSRGTKITDLQKDLDTISKIISTNNESRKKLSERLPKKYNTYTHYCLLLADFWRDHHSGIKQEYLSESDLKWDTIWKTYKAELPEPHYSNDNIIEEEYSIAYALFELKDSRVQTTSSCAVV